MALADALLAQQIVNRSLNTALFWTKLSALEPYKWDEHDGIKYVSNCVISSEIFTIYYAAINLNTVHSILIRFSRSRTCTVRLNYAVLTHLIMS